MHDAELTRRRAGARPAKHKRVGNLQECSSGAAETSYDSGWPITPPSASWDRDNVARPRSRSLVKAAKLYWRDSGLLHALMGIDSRDLLLAQPWVGASWEGFVIEQVLNALGAAGERSEAYHFRTSDQYELDLVLEHRAQRWAIEVKLTTNPRPGDLAHLDKCADLIGAHRRFLVSQTRQTVRGERTMSGDLAALLAELT